MPFSKLIIGKSPVSFNAPVRAFAKIYANTWQGEHICPPGPNRVNRIIKQKVKEREERAKANSFQGLLSSDLKQFGAKCHLAVKVFTIVAPLAKLS